MRKTGITPSLPCDAAELIPHRPPMRLVDRLVHKGEETEADPTVIEAVVPEAGPFVGDAGLEPEYFIEVMAQSVAAGDGFPPESDTPPATGFLAGIDTFSWYATARPGDRLEVRVFKVFEFGSAFIFEGVITRAGERIAAGRLKIWRAER
ncbi:MAG: hypothetical protein Kow0089_05590 [Desulfobulbaceae bacterium]